MKIDEKYQDDEYLKNHLKEFLEHLYKICSDDERMMFEIALSNINTTNLPDEEKLRLLLLLFQLDSTGQFEIETDEADASIRTIMLLLQMTMPELLKSVRVSDYLENEMKQATTKSFNAVSKSENFQAWKSQTSDQKIEILQKLHNNMIDFLNQGLGLNKGPYTPLIPVKVSVCSELSEKNLRGVASIKFSNLFDSLSFNLNAASSEIVLELEGSKNYFSAMPVLAHETAHIMQIQLAKQALQKEVNKINLPKNLQIDARKLYVSLKYYAGFRESQHYNIQCCEANSKVIEDHAFYEATMSYTGSNGMQHIHS